MRSPRRRPPLLFVALLACTVVTACSGSEGSSATATVPGIALSVASVPTTTVAPTTVAPTTVAPTTVALTTTVAPTTVPRALDQVPQPEASTVDDLLALERPIVIAHAGGDFEAPHSTMYAFTLAALAGTDVLEMDVMLTADRQLVVQHDDTVDRTTETSGRVRDLTYDQLAVLDNAYWFSGDVWVDQSLPDDAYIWRGVRTGDRPAPEGFTPDDFRVETFRSVATAFPGHVLDVELKVPAGDDGQPDLAWAIEGAEVLAAEIAELGRADSVVVVSFDASVLDAFRGFAPDVATSPGLDTLVAWYTGTPVEFATSDRVFQVPPFYSGVEVLTPEVVARAQADGFEVWVWMDDTSTQETVDFYATLLERGVDGLLVSRPAAAVELLAAGS